ncbi:hypothetical protein LIV57_20680 [Chryseobacterium sp. X308]|uniref:hypothetical protein n=1 Tax=Chryseobacterium sp. X308 TaxID=2884873 RepID=UPI001D14C929|nr:hypothetical protein [Chryseobacterium sp. X308]MCC3217684.1 hypothetical protein [Chryseobacterium sp. X308]
MEFKSFVEPSNMEEEKVKSALAENGKNAVDDKFKLLNSNKMLCIKCNSDQNVKLANSASLSENKDENQYPLCENCRKASFKVKIFR